MDQEIRNKLRNIVTKCRRLLGTTFRKLKGKYAIFAKKDQVTADPNAKMTHLTEEEQAARKDILDHFAHIKARSSSRREALDQLVREIAFTHLNRLCAYKMMEAREVYVGGQKFREAVSRGSSPTASSSTWRTTRKTNDSSTPANRMSRTGISWTGWAVALRRDRRIVQPE